MNRKFNNFCFLKKVNFKNLEKWYVSYYINPFSLKSKYNFVKLKNIIKPYKNIITKEEYTGKIKIVEKITFKDGKIHLRKENKTGMNLYELKPNQLLISKINFHQGAVAINKGSVLYCSTHYQPYDVDYSKIMEDFLILSLRSKIFQNNISYLRAEGIKNEATFDFIGDLEIPLPSIQEQKKILQKYNNRIKFIETQKKEILILEKQIETFLFSSLGITILNNAEKEDNNYLKVVELKDLDRWDIFSQNFSIENILNKSKFSLKRLGKEYNFINRAWNKKEYKKKQFFYIEIGDIDPILGITNAKELNVEKAPSRATQIIKNKDLIIGTTRPYLKKFAIVDNKYDSCICSSGFSVIESSSKYNLSFLKEYLMSSIGTEQLKNNMSGGLYPAITTEKFKNIKIPIPPLDIQNEIVYQIDIIRNKIKQLKKDVEQNKVLAQNEFEKEIFK